MIKIDVVNIKGEKIGKVSLPEEIFASKINKPLMAQAVRVYLSNQRQASAKVKSRSEVNASGRKIYRQKGTGRARHGDKKAPIFVKGGVAHGPTGQENFKLKMSKKMKQKALFSSLSSKLKNQQFIVVEGLEKIKPKTKDMVKVILNIKNKILKSDKNKKVKFTFLLPGVLDNVIRAGRNIPNIELRQVRLLNTYRILNGGVLVLMKDSIKVLKDTFLNKKSNE